MAKYTTVECAHCGIRFEKETKEFKRRSKLGKKLYCNLQCAGHVLAENLKDSNGDFHRSTSAHMKAIQERAAAANRRYTSEARPFREHIRRCEKRGKEFDLDIEFLMNLWTEQEGRCAITGIPMQQVYACNFKPVMASLDRKVSTGGYTRGNVQFVTHGMNMAKHAGTDADAHEFSKLIFENYKK